MPQALDYMACDQERHGLLNVLCKLCSRRQKMPRSMHIDRRLDRELIKEDNGGHATVFRAGHKGHRVAVKTVRIHLTSNIDKCTSVNVLSHMLHIGVSILTMVL